MQASSMQAANAVSNHLCPPQVTKSRSHLVRRKMRHCRATVPAAGQVVDDAQAQPQPAQPTGTRRAVCSAAISLAISLANQEPADAKGSDDKLYKAFIDAFSAQGFEAQDAAWTRAINLAPENSAAWSNRGTLRLQNNMWAAAQADLGHAVQLEVQQKKGQQAAREGEGTDITGLQGSSADAELQMVDPSTLNNLGNAEVALGRYNEARSHFAAAALQRGSGIELLAQANLALVSFEVGNEAAAVREVRQILRKDPNFLDMRAALTAFLYGSGKQAEAEGEWEKLQQSQDGFGSTMYSKGMAISRVQNRWPPRATAALDAYLNLSAEGKALGYDMEVHTYKFPF